MMAIEIELYGTTWFFGDDVLAVDPPTLRRKMTIDNHTILGKPVVDERKQESKTRKRRKPR